MEQALRDDYGGTIPLGVFYGWLEMRARRSDKNIFGTLEGKESMVKLWERWNDRDRIRQQFWAFDLDDASDFPRDYPISEERIVQIKQCLLDWLQKRKDGQLY